MNGPLPPNATIGLVGGGQLGRMSALAAARLGYRCHILTRETDSPAAQVSHAVTISDYEDPESLRAFAAAVDVISFEFENVSAEGLDLLASLKPVRPAPSVLRISQDRVTEKSFLNNAGVATAPWRLVQTLSDLEAAVAALGLPSVLKTTRLGYDGKGQAMLRTPEDLAPAFERLSPKPLILEGFVDFAREISVVIARGADGAVSAFDTVENRHRDHILDVTLAPARVTAEVDAAAQRIARDVAGALDLVGLLAVEMFVDRAGAVLANEIAPRPHNSGHWTIDACPMSQFEAHIRSIAGSAPLRRGDEEPGGTRRSRAVAGDCRQPRPDPAPLRQGRGASRPQDRARHPPVSARCAAGRIRRQSRARGARLIACVRRVRAPRRRHPRGGAAVGAHTPAPVPERPRKASSVPRRFP
jgi:5-(carboxyamino)imidazole ribonucleotide synthase